ncbi:MAG: hypothetical protein ACLUJR_09115 [Mediterraneibacter gnavus]
MKDTLQDVKEALGEDACKNPKKCLSMIREKMPLLQHAKDAGRYFEIGRRHLYF